MTVLQTDLTEIKRFAMLMIIYIMKSLGVGGVVGIGEGVFHAPTSFFFSFPCRNVGIYVSAGHFDPPPAQVGLSTTHC